MDSDSHALCCLCRGDFGPLTWPVRPVIPIDPMGRFGLEDGKPSSIASEPAEPDDATSWVFIGSRTGVNSSNVVTHTYISRNSGSMTALCVKHASGPPDAVKFEKSSVTVPEGM